MSRWTRLTQSFWFLPAVLCLVAVVLAEGLIVVDRRFGGSDLGAFDILITRVGESGSRDLLGAIAGSMLTVASTTFSITIAVLALSSSTYGPRLVRNFMADRGNQLVLGIFVATFLYSLLVLRAIREIDGGGEGYFVPHLAVNVAVMLAVLSIGVLVYFIHHISDSVQVWTLADQVRVDLAREYDVVVRMHVRPGRHVTSGVVLAVVSPADRLDDGPWTSMRRCVQIGRARNPQQDVEFPALLLEEMRFYAIEHPTVLHRALEQVGAACPDPRMREAMARNAPRTLEAFAATSPQDADLRTLDDHAARVHDALAGTR